MNPVKVSYRDNKYYVFDGQHTLAELKARNANKDVVVNCKVYYGLTKERESKLFSEQNGISRSIKANAKLKALYTANDVDVVDMYNIIKSEGIIMDFSESKNVNKIIACATTFKIYSRLSKDEFKMFLHIIRESWNGASDSFNREILNGMYMLCTTYHDVIDEKTAINQFVKTTPKKIIEAGKEFNTKSDTCYASQLLNVYNKGLRGQHRLDIFRLMIRN